MTFLIESLVACALFSLFVHLMLRDPVYPPAIIERCRQLGLVNDSNSPGGPVFYAKKITALIVFGVLLGLVVKYVNGVHDPGAGSSRPMLFGRQSSKLLTSL